MLKKPAGFKPQTAGLPLLKKHSFVIPEKPD
jgi:hypothetical protein